MAGINRCKFDILTSCVEKNCNCCVQYCFNDEVWEREVIDEDSYNIKLKVRKAYN